MTLFTGFVVYVLTWWTVLFAVLPIGTHPEPDGDLAAGGWRGTPRKVHLLRKLIATTLVSAVIWLAIWYLVESDWISFRTGWLAMPDR